jgi:monofunctional biosynthetic peptidoglycan transglycosylase
MKGRRGPRPVRRKRAGIGRLFRWLFHAVIAFIILSLLWVLLYKFVPPPITFTQIGDLVSGRGVDSHWMSIDKMDRNMVRAAIASEDGKFCTHHGFDADAIVKAMERNARGGSVIRGGSTISQQTAKNAFLWQGGGYFRKGLEAWFTLLIEQIWGKRRIMEVYLNIAETGLGTYGANAGSQRYFRHDASSLSRIEAARLAAIFPLPKKRGAVAPRGFTLRYGNMIAARMGVVARGGLDGCVYKAGGPTKPLEPAPPKAPTPRKPAPAPAPEPVPQVVPGEEYEQPAAPPPSEPPSESEPPPPAETSQPSA